MNGIRIEVFFVNAIRRTMLSLIIIFCLVLTGCAESFAPKGESGAQEEYASSQTASTAASDSDIAGESIAADLTDTGSAAAGTANEESISAGTANEKSISAGAANEKSISAGAASLSDIPEYSGTPYIVINDNMPDFDKADFTSESFEVYSEQDSLGRCGKAYANIGTDLMPEEAYASIGQIRPSGWHTIKYDIVDGNYLYNRCHLIGYQLTGEGSNPRNLITGTRYLNVTGMLPFENMTADYIKSTGNHVLYRVTPVFSGGELVARGVHMEAASVEDNGSGVMFNVYCYNVQPGIIIDYATGESRLEEVTETGADSVTEAVTETVAEAVTEMVTEAEPAYTEISEEVSEEVSEPDQTYADNTADTDATYIVNTNTRKFHYPSCASVKKIKDYNKWEYTGTRDNLIDLGYSPCKNCNP